MESVNDSTGVAMLTTSAPVQADYFACDEVRRLTLPDGVSWIDHRVLNEGQRRKYLTSVNRDVRLQRQTGDAFLKMSPGDEKKALLESAMCGWNLVRNGEPIPFSAPALRDFLDRANPTTIDLIEFEIRKANPWLQSEMSVADMNKELERLTELRDAKIREDEGKASS